MRLICPNCGAQYEVGDDVIPRSGRDVQCSNCGNTWFETPGASLAAEARPRLAMPDVTEDREPDETVSAAPARRPAPPPTRAPEPADTAPDDTPYDDDLDDDAPVAPPLSDPSRLGGASNIPPVTERPTPAQRPAVESSIAAILREEAAREQTARAVATAGLESQGELGIDQHVTAPTPVDDGAASRIARLRGAPAPQAEPAMRRDTLPDIEQINSSLRSDSERGAVPPPLPEDVERAERGGFRFGFFTVLIILALLALTYIFAGAIAAAVPAAEPALTGYVSTVDALRARLDGMVSNLVTAVEAE